MRRLSAGSVRDWKRSGTKTPSRRGELLSVVRVVGLWTDVFNAWLAVLFHRCIMFRHTSHSVFVVVQCGGISGKHVGALFGLMNSVGVFGAMSSTYLVGAIADSLGSQGYTGRDQWDPIFYINMGVLGTAGLLWSTFIYKNVESEAVAGFVRIRNRS